MLDINEIAAKMTREEFVRKLEKNGYGESLDCDYTCPNDLDLEEYNACDITCKECWLNAIKNIKFKEVK